MYASNFSIGVNIMFHLNRRLATIMKQFDYYNPAIEEIHHTRKLDAPSGTAITIASDIVSELKRIKKWGTGPTGNTKEEIPVFSKRIGKVPGTHTVSWLSESDKITIGHEAFSREGFAIGAVFAAEYIQNKKGVYNMSDMLGF